jgi:uncharacterized protein (DUF924 family)
MTRPEDVLETWFEGEPGTYRERWFKLDPAFDEALRQRLGPAAEAALRGELEDWAETPKGALALCILLDQLPRNLHRGTARAFAADPLARTVARHAVLGRAQDLALTEVERIFLYLPFEHSEDQTDQDLSVALFEGLRDDPLHARPGGTVDYAWRHWRIIRRFGRFPHRNAALGRPTTSEEAAFLQQPGSSF